MTAFEAKTDWKTLKKKENKNYRFVSFLPDAQQKIPKKIAKKFKKFKKTIMASFEAKIEWKRSRKRKNKNHRYISFLPDA